MFDGETFDKEKDGFRLQSQLQRVFMLMRDGNFRSLHDIAETVGGTEAAISARLRDLRKIRFGGYQVERKRVNGGLWVYALKGASSEEIFSSIVR